MATAVMTYNTLVSDVKAYLERGGSTDTEVIAQIPRFIMLAQERIAREVKVLGTIQYVSGNMASGVSVYAKPGRWRETVHLNFGSGTGNNTRNFLFKRNYDALRSYWPDDTQTGTPAYYAEYNFTHFLVVPTPNAAYPFELAYWELPEPIDTGNQTNWLTQYAPDLLLYATLLETAPFLKTDERIQVWQQMYDRAAKALGAEDAQRGTDSAANPMKVIP
jgi:hypothetical protein